MAVTIHRHYHNRILEAGEIKKIALDITHILGTEPSAISFSVEYPLINGYETRQLTLEEFAKHAPLKIGQSEKYLSIRFSEFTNYIMFMKFDGQPLRILISTQSREQATKILDLIEKELNLVTR